MTKSQLRDKQICIPRVKFKFTNSRDELFSLTVFQKPQLQSSSKSVPSLVFALLFKPFVNVLSGYFCFV